MGLIRLILAIGVVFSHSGLAFGFTTLGGSIAVQAFYIISGFYIALILNEKYVNENDSYKLFISNRLLRIYPIYWVVLAITLVSTIVLSQTKTIQFSNSYVMFQLYHEKMNFTSILFMVFTNVFLFFQDVVMFLGLNTSDGSLFFTTEFHNTQPKLFYFLFVPQGWSIGVELTFYLIAPFIAKKKLQTIVILIACSFLIRMIIYYHFNLNHEPWTYRFFPSELLFFLLGIAAYHAYNKLKDKKINTFILYSAWISVLLFTIGYRYFNIPGKMILYFILFVCALPLIFILSKNWKIDRQLGELSYPVYICHIFILSWVGLLHLPAGGWRTIIVIIISIAFSYLLNFFVGNKIEKYRQNRLKK